MSCLVAFDGFSKILWISHQLLSLVMSCKVKIKGIYKQLL